MNEILIPTSVRLSPDAKKIWKQLAELDNRSMANFMEELIYRELERRSNKEVSLHLLRDDVVAISKQINELHELLIKPKATKTNNKDELEKIFNINLPFDVDSEVWKEWVIHLKKLGVRVNYYSMEKHAEKLFELDKEDWDCNELLRYLISNNKQSIFIPFEWVKGK